jgi:hypothetical protein
LYEKQTATEADANASSATEVRTTKDGESQSAAASAAPSGLTDEEFEQALCRLRKAQIRYGHVYREFGGMWLACVLYSAIHVRKVALLFRIAFKITALFDKPEIEFNRNTLQTIILHLLS